MIYHYHPILGLQYLNYDCDIVIDKAVIPKGWDMNKAMKQMRKTGIMFVNSKVPNPLQRIHKIYNNLFTFK